MSVLRDDELCWGGDCHEGKSIGVREDGSQAGVEDVAVGIGVVLPTWSMVAS